MDDTPDEPPNPLAARPPSGLTLRAVEPSDAEGLAALLNAPGFRHGTMQMPFRSVAAVRARLEQGDPARVSIVAVRNGALVGSATLTRLEGRRSHVAGLGLGVHDDHRGRGIGSALLAALVELADDWLMLARLELTVHADNAPAIRLYERAGFEREGLLRSWTVRAGALVDALAMARLRP